MFIKVFIILLMLAVLVSLGSALYFLVNDKGDNNRTVKALSWRIGLSLGLFALLIIGYLFGIITPHGLFPAG